MNHPKVQAVLIALIWISIGLNYAVDGQHQDDRLWVSRAIGAAAITDSTRREIDTPSRSFR